MTYKSPKPTTQLRSLEHELKDTSDCCLDTAKQTYRTILFSAVGSAAETTAMS